MAISKILGFLYRLVTMLNGTGFGFLNFDYFPLMEKYIARLKDKKALQTKRHGTTPNKTEVNFLF
jgi:hypothetical protein